MKRTLVFSILLELAAGCTAKRPYDTLLKDRVHDKSAIDTNALYLYLPSVVDSARSTTATRPYWMGEAKLVKFEFTEKDLRLVEAEVDPRFQDNKTNNKPVLSIDVEHLDYNCIENSNGECTNKEQVNDKITWDQKTKFRPHFENLKIEEVNFLPLEIQNLFGNCYTELGTEFLGYELSGSALNIHAEKTFRANLMCLDDLESLSDVNFRVRYQYSVVKLSDLTSNNYAAINYPVTDQNTFGYFTTTRVILSPDLKDEEKREVTYLNRWAPGREVVYYMNAPFKKPENAKLREATFHSFETINASLAKAGANVKLVLRDAPDGMLVGDLRNNFLVMVEDPQAMNVIGYGPTAANPLTGEIVHGRVVMYSGTIKKFIKYSYEDIRKSRLQVEPPVVTTFVADAAMVDKAARIEKAFAKSDKGGIAKDSLEAVFSKVQGRKDIHVDIQKLTSEAKKMVKEYTRNSEKDSRLKNQIAMMSYHCMYPADEASEALSTAFDKLLPGDLKPWDELSDAERQRILDLAMPVVWIPTLVHEMGHNLGLRHNFAGSEDKDNFYTVPELNAMGVDFSVPYSSIMDYSYRTTNELPLMGKYDVAALRYGYARQVALQDGSTLNVSSTLADAAAQGATLKEFQYCTDEHVSVNAGCKRFDEGSTLTEIASHFIKEYEDSYKRRNFRNGVRRFSIFDEAAYRARRDDLFYSLRVFLEVYNSILARFSNIDQSVIDGVPFIKDLKEAATLAGQEMLNAVATPDISCAIAPAADPTNTIVDTLPLRFLDGFLGKQNISCTNPDVAGLLSDNGLKSVVQIGKSFESLKDPLSDNPYADQIDVRGIRTDKELALDYLLKRKMDIMIFDKWDNQKSFLDQDDVGLQLLKLTRQVLFDRISSTAVITSTKGDTKQVPVTTQFSTTQRDVIKEVLASIQRNVPSSKNQLDSQAILELFQVRTEKPQGVTIADSVSFGSKTFFAQDENAIALTAMSLVKMVRDVDPVLALEGGRQKLAAIVQLLKDGKPLPATATAAEKKVYSTYSADQLSLILDGLVNDEAYYFSLLSSLLPAT